MTDIIITLILMIIIPPMLYIYFQIQRESSKAWAEEQARDEAWAEQQAWDEVYGCPGHSRWAPKDNELCDTCKLVHRSDYLPRE